MVLPMVYCEYMKSRNISLIMLLLLTIVILFIPSVSANYSPMYSYRSTMNPMLFIGIINFPINLFVLVLLLSLLRTIGINLDRTPREIYYGLLCSVLFCTIIGAIVDYNFLYREDSPYLYFNVFKWFIGFLLIIISYFIAFYIWMRRYVVPLFISVMVGLLNLLSWSIILYFNEELTFYDGSALIMSGILLIIYIVVTLFLAWYSRSNDHFKGLKEDIYAESGGLWNEI